MKAIFIDDYEMEALVAKLKNYPLFGQDNVYKFGGDISTVKEWLNQQGDQIDVAIIDQFIGDARGTQVGAWINDQYPHIACILLTGGGAGDQEVKEPLLKVCMDAMESGFCAFMLKGNENADTDLLYQSLDRVLSLPSVKGKQQLKNSKLKGDMLDVRLKSNYQECDLYATEFCLDSIELIAKLSNMLRGQHETATLAYSRSFRKIVEELKDIDLGNGKQFSLQLLGNSTGKKRYAAQMESIRNYFRNFDFKNEVLISKILNGFSAKEKMNINNLHSYFQEPKNKDISYILLTRHPDRWNLVRQHFSPIKAITKEYRIC